MVLDLLFHLSKAKAHERYQKLILRLSSKFLLPHSLSQFLFRCDLELKTSAAGGGVLNFPQSTHLSKSRPVNNMNRVVLYSLETKYLRHKKSFLFSLLAGRIFKAFTSLLLLQRSKLWKGNVAQIFSELTDDPPVLTWVLAETL